MAISAFCGQFVNMSLSWHEPNMHGTIFPNEFKCSKWRLWGQILFIMYLNENYIGISLVNGSNINGIYLYVFDLLF